MSKDAAFQRSLKARLAASDELAKEMTLCRKLIISAEHRGDWLVASAARTELKKLHELAARKDYSDAR